MIVRSTRVLRKVLLAGLVVATAVEGRSPAYALAQSTTPNIVFIILDDVGKDQLTMFNPAAGTAALTPNLNAVAAAGVKFTNLYTMPECSPSRVAFFTGRYPMRTGVTAAILDQDLPAAQISPFEVTTPKVLATAGYRSALIGKYHLGGPENNPDGNGAPIAEGWNYFNGNLRGAPAPIDASLGGQYTQDKTKYSCGFPTGPERGAAWFRGIFNQAQCDDNKGAGYTGKQAVAQGGIPALDAQGNLAPTCGRAAGSGADFTKPNGYYVWPQAIGDSSGTQTPRARQYMTSAQTDAAIAWIREQSTWPARNHRWMATVSYNAIHTPYQPPPAELLPPGFSWPSSVPENCTDAAAVRILSDLMLAAMDQEIGRLLVSIGVARRDAAGQLDYHPEATDTMIVIVGDNGTFIPGVKTPYDPSRAKATPYETGVTAPMIVAGPLVKSPGRSVDSLVNAVDLFQLFGEIAGVDVRAVVPSSHALDATPVLAYLTNPAQPSVRQFNFTQLGTGLKPPSVKFWPCVVRVGPLTVATDVLFTSAGPCEDNSGTWFGPTPAQPSPLYPTSCAVRASGLFPTMMILPTRVWALRNSRYKLVKVERPSCEIGLGEYEFYDLTLRLPTNPLALDLATANLLTNGQAVALTPDQVANFEDLKSQLQALLDSERLCYGDGDLDKRVDLSDLPGLSSLFHPQQPSVFDYNQDGVTDSKDKQCVMTNLNNDCRARGPGTPCK